MAGFLFFSAQKLRIPGSISPRIRGFKSSPSTISKHRKIGKLAILMNYRFSSSVVSPFLWNLCAQHCTFRSLASQELKSGIKRRADLKRTWIIAHRKITPVCWRSRIFFFSLPSWENDRGQFFKLAHRIIIRKWEPFFRSIELKARILSPKSGRTLKKFATLCLGKMRLNQQ